MIIMLSLPSDSAHDDDDDPAFLSEASTHIQANLEDAVTDFVRYWVRRCGVSDVAVCGGIFANVKLNQRIAELERALARLSVEHREILLLRDIEDMPYEDIAQVLGIGLGTVKSRIARPNQATCRRRAVWRPFDACARSAQTTSTGNHAARCTHFQCSSLHAVNPHHPAATTGCPLCGGVVRRCSYLPGICRPNLWYF